MIITFEIHFKKLQIYKILQEIKNGKILFWCVKIGSSFTHAGLPSVEQLDEDDVLPLL